MDGSELLLCNLIPEPHFGRSQITGDSRWIPRVRVTNGSPISSLRTCRVATVQLRNSAGFRRFATDASRVRSRRMLRWFLKRQVAAFERTWNYDASYMHEVIDADPRAMLAFGKLQAISSYRKDVSPAAYFAAGIVAVMAE